MFSASTILYECILAEREREYYAAVLASVNKKSSAKRDNKRNWRPFSKVGFLLHVYHTVISSYFTCTVPSSVKANMPVKGSPLYAPEPKEPLFEAEANSAQSNILKLRENMRAAASSKLPVISDVHSAPSFHVKMY